jgi:hypothetical protein
VSALSLYSTLGRLDPAPWLLASDEPAARWVALLRLRGLAEGSSEALDARRAVVRDPATQALIARIPDWEADCGVGGHDAPRLATNLLDLLGSMGVRESDDPRICALLDQMLAHTDEAGRFQMFAAERGGETPHWGALLCDTHSTADALLAFGRGGDPRVGRALATAAVDVTATGQGLAWPCRPATGDTWRGPGRIRDCCPQTTLEALRAFSRLPAEERPAMLRDVATTVLGIWRSRGEHKPYMFGHGRQFKQVKWPPTWYGAYEVVDTLGRLPEVWSGPDARSDDVTSLAEIAACLLAYNVSADSTVTPLSTFQGFEEHSFGQKRRPSPFATALVWGALARLEPIADRIAGVDVMALGSSKGGSGAPLPPKVADPA